MLSSVYLLIVCVYIYIPNGKSNEYLIHRAVVQVMLTATGKETLARVVFSSDRHRHTQHCNAPSVTWYGLVTV